MAWRRASFASLSTLRWSASVAGFDLGSAASSSLHDGQRLANPGLPGFSSNSSPQATQILIGYGIAEHLQFYRMCSDRSDVAKLKL